MYVCSVLQEDGAGGRGGEGTKIADEATLLVYRISPNVVTYLCVAMTMNISSILWHC